MGRNRKGCRCSQAGENTHCGRANRVLPTIARQFQSSAQHRVLGDRATEERLRQNTEAAFAGCRLGAPRTGRRLTLIYIMSTPERFQFKSDDGLSIACVKWGNDRHVRGVVQISHGLGEHIGRYAELADFLVEDMVSLRVIAKNEHPDKPYILLGHSMSSFAAQQFVLDHSHSIDGLALSGSGALDRSEESRVGK